MPPEGVARREGSDLPEVRAGLVVLTKAGPRDSAAGERAKVLRLVVDRPGVVRDRPRPFAQLGVGHAPVVPCPAIPGVSLDHLSIVVDRFLPLSQVAIRL